MDVHATHNGHGGPATDGFASAEEAGDGQAAQNGDVLKVSARSRPSAVAGAIAGVVREAGRAEV
ncbi:MAG: stage V sporulation protein S, partial [Chloroflexota bacterium]|nr:stage V sporulation protein S [Chloroflexota bacterium]